MGSQNNNALPNGTILRHGRTEYRIERFLGAGGFGITYLVSGHVKVSGKDITVKYCVKEHFLSKDCWRDHTTNAVACSKPAEERVTEGKKDFIAEAKRLRDKIQHSHIVRVKDVFEANDTAYYVMEFLDGKSLRTYIRKYGACEESEAISLLLPIIRAIGYLHDERITHLDVKPDNIMIVESNGKICPTLIDFGLSKHYDKKGKATSTVRIQATSDGYSPVEQYQGIDTFQPTADIYALAATFVFCITGIDPKKSADIRPGELRKLLEGNLSSGSLIAILNGMKPSQYERTPNVKSFLTELCPGVEFVNWNTESDNNITDPVFLKKKKSSNSFISRLKKFFIGKDDRVRKLDIPDVSIFISIDYPKGTGYSKKIWLCQAVCNTIVYYDGDDVVEDEDFAGGIYEDIQKYLMDSGLLDDYHWEQEIDQNRKESKALVGITFNYSDGRKFERVGKSPKLYSSVKGLLECPSIGTYLSKYDNYESMEKRIPTVPIVLESTMLAYYNGMLTSIDILHWQQLTQDERLSFHPFIIELIIERKRISLFIEEKTNVLREDAEKVLEYYNRQLCPSGISGYETGECRLLSSEEMDLMDSNYGRVQKTFSEWGLSLMKFPQWICNNGHMYLYPVITGPAATLGNIRPFVNYYGTYAVYSQGKKIEEFSMDGLKLITFPEYGDYGVSLYYSPEIATHLRIRPIKTEIRGKTSDDSYMLFDMVHNSDILHFPADDETPSFVFWNSVKKNGAFLLESNLQQFLTAAKLQYNLKKSNPQSMFRIINPVTLYAFWSVLIKRKTEINSHTVAMDGYSCSVDFGDGVCRIESLTKNNQCSAKFEEDPVIKGATIQQMILKGNITSILLMDIMEYEIALSVEQNGRIRDHIIFVPAQEIFPTRHMEKISYDVIRESEVYLYIGGLKIDVELTPYCGDVQGEGIVSISVEMDANKLIKYFGKINEHIRHI